MPLFPSDFKKFKHVKSDDKTTTLRHDAGHTITIMHKALSGNMRKQLEALRGTTDEKPKAKEARGGEVCMQEGGIVASAKRSGMLGTQNQVDQQISDEQHPSIGAGYVNYNTTPARSPASESVDVRTPEQKARAIEVSKEYGYAEGGQVDVAATSPNLDAAKLQYNKLLYGVAGDPTANPPPIPGKTFGPNGEAPEDINPSVWEQAKAQSQNAIENTDKQKADEQATQRQEIEAKNKARMEIGQQPLPMPADLQPEQQTAPQPQSTPEPQQQPMQQVAQPPHTTTQQPLMQTPESIAQKGYEQSLAGINAEAQAKGALGAEQSKLLDQQAKAIQETQTAYKQNFDSLDNERKSLIADINAGHVDPEKFWDNHSRVAAGIGMILAGFNPSGGQNAVVKYLDNQMDMNLQAQKENLGAKKSLLEANLRQFGNLHDATQMTKIMQADILSNQLQQAAAKAANPMAKAAALQAAGDLQMKYAPQAQAFAMKRALMSLGTGESNKEAGSTGHMLSYLDAANPEMAKAYRQRYFAPFDVPGGKSLADREIPEAAMKDLTSHIKFDSAVKDLQQFVKTHNTLNPMSQDYTTGALKAQELQALVRESLLGTVFRESEKPLLEAVVNSNPAGVMKMIKTNPQLEELLKSNMRNFKASAATYGLQPPASMIKSEPVERKTQDGRTALFDPETKKFLGYK